MKIALPLALFALAGSPASSQVPSILNYQGRVTVGGSNFTGAGQFKFALVSSNGAATYWRNDGSTNAGEPSSAVSVAASQGLCSTLLGDTALPNMAALPPGVFTNSDVNLRVWFSPGGTNAFLQLSPDQRIAAAGYALRAASADAVSSNAIGDLQVSGTLAAQQLVGGSNNTATGDLAFVGGGTENAASGMFSVVAGGSLNTNTGIYATISGGANNLNTGAHGAIGGGAENSNGGQFSVVAGGYRNTNTADYATISGGDHNANSGDGAAIGGGWKNTNTGQYPVIGGGIANVNSGWTAVIGGGSHNTNSGWDATIGGGLHNTNSAQYAVIGGGRDNAIVAGGTNAVISGGQANAASQPRTFVGGGYNNSASGPSAAVAGGSINTASGSYAFAGGGQANYAMGSMSAVAGGGQNAAGEYSFVGGGYENVATNNNATVAGGWLNKAVGAYSFVGGGHTNTAAEWAAVVVGGKANTAAGAYSTVAGGSNNTGSAIYATVPGGTRAKATNAGAFVWSGLDTVDTVSTNASSFTVRAPGGVRFITTDATNNLNITEVFNTNNGVALAPGGTQWQSLSDSNSKTDFAPIAPREILAKVAALPVTSWHYKHDPSRRYIGPMAQDFHAAFGLGSDDKSIGTLDTDGVMYAAIQGLVAELNDRDKVIGELKAQNEELSRKIEAIGRRLDALPPAP